MNHRSKREVAPPPLQAASAAAPSCPGVTALQSTSNAMAPPTASQVAWWTGSLPQTNPFSVGPPDCGMDLRPPGGFLSYFQNGQQPIFAPHVSFPAPWPPTCNMSVSASGTDSDTQPDAKRTKAKPVINIDDGNDGRTAKRLVWEKDEDLRLVSKIVILYARYLISEIMINFLLSPTIYQAMTNLVCKERGKAKDDDASLDKEMKKYMDIQAAATKRQEQFLETQQRISDSKVKAASLKREAVLLESYQKLLSMDTKEMSEEMKAEHTIGLKIMRDKLVGNTK